jgi:hypothetical protein
MYMSRPIDYGGKHTPTRMAERHKNKGPTHEDYEPRPPARNPHHKPHHGAQAREKVDEVYCTESRRVFAPLVRPVQEIAGLPKA